MTKMNLYDLVSLHLVPIWSSLGAQCGPQSHAIQTAFSPPKIYRIQKIDHFHSVSSKSFIVESVIIFVIR